MRQARRSAARDGTGEGAARPARRTLPAATRVGDLVAAAGELFVAQGVEATTVDDITARAGVAKGTFYHYFTCKGDVVTALRRRFTQLFATGVAEAVAACPPTDHAGRLQAWLHSAARTYLDHVELHDVVFHDYTHSRRRSDEKDDVIAQLSAILTAGGEAGAWSVPDVRVAAIVLFDGMHGAVDDAIAAGEIELEPLLRTLSGLFARMLAVRGGPEAADLGAFDCPSPLGYGGRGKQKNRAGNVR